MVGAGIFKLAPLNYCGTGELKVFLPVGRAVWFGRRRSLQAAAKGGKLRQISLIIAATRKVFRTCAEARDASPEVTNE